MAQTYKSQIMQWDWRKIVAQCENETPYDGAKWEYLGSCLILSPSGKYYMPWCSNVTEAEAAKDEAWYSALDAVAEKHGGYISSGEGDACDLFFCLSCDDDETEEDE